MPWLWMAAALVALAFGLRVSRLEQQAIWWDEAWSILLAERALGDIARTIAFDAHPPLYQFLMHGWIRLVGISEFAARYLSVLAGVVAVALCVALARRMTASARAGLAAGLVTAASVIGIDWSQEARMYAVGALFAVLLVYAYVRLVSAPARRWRVLALLAAMAAPLSHYIAGFALIVVNLHALLTQRDGRFWRGWLPAMGAAALVVGGWIAFSLTLATRTPREVGDDLLYPIQLWAAVLVNGSSAHLEQYWLPSLLLALTVAAGLLAAGLQRARWGLLALLALALPPLFVWAVNFFLTLPLTDRYYSLMAPLGLVSVVLLLHALGRSGWPGRAAVLGAAGLLGMFGWVAVYRDWDERVLRDEHTTLLRAVALLAQPGDTVLFISGERRPLVEYPLRRLYFPAPTPFRLHAVPSGADWPTRLPQLTQTLDDGWLVFVERFLGDRDGAREAWLRAQFTVVAESSVDHNGWALLSRDGRAAYPSLDAVLPPLLREARPGMSVRVGVPAGVTAALQVGDVTLQSVTPSRWDVVSFPIHPAYPNGDYRVRVGDASFPLRVTHAQPAAAVAGVPLADFGALALLEGEAAWDGRAVEVWLRWRGAGGVSAPLNVFVHVVGPWNSAASSPLWGQSDGPPAQTPLHAWVDGLIASETRRIPLPPLPAGQYEVRVGLYDWTNGVRLLLPDGRDALSLMTFSVP